MTNESNLRKALAARQKALDAQLAALILDQTAAIRQISRTHDDVEANRLQRKVDDLQEKIDQLHGNLDQKSFVEGDYNERHQKWESRLALLDSHKAFREFQRSYDLLEQNSGAGLYVLRNNRSMAGKLCIERIWNHICERTGEPRRYSVGFSAGSGTPYHLLHSLSEYVNEPPFPHTEARYKPFKEELDRQRMTQEDLAQYCSTLINAMGNSLRNGHAILIELKQCDFFCRQPHMTWFMDQFWAAIQRKLQEIASQGEYSAIKVIVIMLFDSDLPYMHLPPALCVSDGKLNPEKIVDLPLSNWTRTDIEKWLRNHPGLPNPRIAEIIEVICGQNRSITPLHAYHALLDYL
jgi:hypothetical protein